MRKRFEQQLTIGRLPISETPIPTGKRGGALPKLCAALRKIFITPEWNERIFEILKARITAGKKATGRPGMDLWQIFVLSQVRLCQNIFDNVSLLDDETVRELNLVIVEFGHAVFKKKRGGSIVLKDG